MAPRTGPTRSLESRQAFSDLYRKHVAAIYGYAARRSTPQQAEDIVAETFLVAWRRIEDVPSDALPWLLGVARRVLANARRGASRRESLRQRLRLLPGHPAEPDPAEEAGSRAAVLRALQRLSPAEREALTLIAWEGLDTAQAAVAAGCTRATLAVRLHRAKRRLMKDLGPGGHGESAGPEPAGFEEAEAR